MHVVQVEGNVHAWAGIRTICDDWETGFLDCVFYVMSSQTVAIKFRSDRLLENGPKIQKRQHTVLRNSRFLRVSTDDNGMINVSTVVTKPATVVNFVTSLTKGD